MKNSVLERKFAKFHIVTIFDSSEDDIFWEKNKPTQSECEYGASSDDQNKLEKSESEFSGDGSVDSVDFLILPRKIRVHLSMVC